jgi:hypothetical protein
MSAQRQASQVVADFAAAADRLQAMAADWAVGQFRHHDTANADAILRGLAALLIELRQGASND